MEPSGSRFCDVPAHAQTSSSACSTVIISCLDGIYNGTYTSVDEWNGKPHYTNGSGAHFYFYDANEGGTRGWSLDDRDQSSETPPGGRDWYNGGWFNADNPGYFEYCPPTGNIAWNDGSSDNICIVLPGDSCSCL